MTSNIRTPAVAAVLLVAMIGLFIKLGYWQLDRADQKTELAQAGQQKVSLESLLTSPEQCLWAQTTLSGHYVNENPSLLDNQSYQGQAGYQVFSRFQLQSGQQLLINRGWVTKAEGRTVKPPPQGATAITGLVAPYRLAGMRLGDAVVSPAAQQPVVVNYPTHQEWQTLYQQPLLTVTLWLNADQPDGYLRDWQLHSVPAEKHWGYAFQWFAMAAAVAVISLILLIRLWRKHD